MTTFRNIKLSEFRGKWVVLFSHTGDFPQYARLNLCICKIKDRQEKTRTFRSL
ncbi:redoxin domain-containing protein [Desulfonispora thiosulfatigenes]|uniref:redoxin domain-containing protein n=1 Tax=Desulfonispora thiosulfatigenes TaxID=83661 RepID=UPI001178065C